MSAQHSGVSENEKKWRSKWNRMTEEQKLMRRMQRAESMRKLRQLRRDSAATRVDTSNNTEQTDIKVLRPGDTTHDSYEINLEMVPLKTTSEPMPTSWAQAINMSNALVVPWLKSVDTVRGRSESIASSLKDGYETVMHGEETSSLTPYYPHLQSVESLFLLNQNVEDIEWTRNLFSWFAGGYKRTHRYAAYVLGVGGEGKTRVVRGMTKGMRVFECRLTEPYAFEGFDENTDILLLDDMNWNCFDVALRSTLLCIMARQPATIQRKHKPQTTVANDRVLTVFTSNYKLPTDTAYRRRTYIVWAKAQACKDAAVKALEDDPGDGDTGYVNPMPVAHAQAVKRIR
jgi:hypothetical protein